MTYYSTDSGLRSGVARHDTTRRQDVLVLIRSLQWQQYTTALEFLLQQHGYVYFLSLSNSHSDLPCIRKSFLRSQASSMKARIVSRDVDFDSSTIPGSTSSFGSQHYPVWNKTLPCTTRLLHGILLRCFQSIQYIPQAPHPLVMAIAGHPNSATFRIFPHLPCRTINNYPIDFTSWTRPNTFPPAHSVIFRGVMGSFTRDDRPTSRKGLSLFICLDNSSTW